MNQQHQAPGHKLRRWLLMLLCIKAIGIALGAVAGWFVAGNVANQIRGAAAFAGALLASFVISIILHFIRGIFAIKTSPTVTPKMDWRERSRRINERTLRNFKWLRKRAWIFALAYSVLATGGYVVMEHSFFLVFSFPFNFLAMFLFVRFTAWFGIKTSVSTDRGRSPTDGNLSQRFK